MIPKRHRTASTLVKTCTFIQWLANDSPSSGGNHAFSIIITSKTTQCLFFENFDLNWLMSPGMPNSLQDIWCLQDFSGHFDILHNHALLNEYHQCNRWPQSNWRTDTFQNDLHRVVSGSNQEYLLKFPFWYQLLMFPLIFNFTLSNFKVNILCSCDCYSKCMFS